MTVADRAQKIVRTLSLIEDTQERFFVVMTMGRRKAPLPDHLKNEKFRIKGCQSDLWLVPCFDDGKCYYDADSDAMITKGIASILVEVYSGGTPQEILDLDPEFLREAGISQHLTPNRSNGLSEICRSIKAFAQLKLAAPTCAKDT